MKTRLLFLLVLLFSACKLDDPEIIPDQPNDNNPEPTNEWMSVRVKLEMHLEGVYYPDIEAPVTVKAFDASQTQQWQEQFTYAGPDFTDLKLKTGFDHYTITFNKWGKTLTQTFKGNDLWSDRVVEGKVPATKVFQSDATARKIIRIVTLRTHVSGDQTTVVPENKSTYSWDQSGKLKGINSYTYDEKINQFVASRLTELNYENNRVSQIFTYPIGVLTPSEQQDFTYDAEGNTSHIRHKNTGTGIVTDVDLSYEYTGRIITAAYRLSNGGAFDYQFVSRNGSILSDKTTRGSQLCSTGAFTSDKNVNPLRHLGYTDYLLRNVSASNRLTENVNYIACSFPSLVAESYEYQYDADGYPVRSVTRYKGTEGTMITEYTYDE